MNDRQDQPETPESSGWNNARWEKQAAAPPPKRNDSALRRFLGGPPGAVVFRLIVVSLVVGALLMWLDIRPADIYFGLRNFFWRIWHMGFDAIHDIFAYIVAGALIVIPVWLALRLLSFGKDRD